MAIIIMKKLRDFDAMRPGSDSTHQHRAILSNPYWRPFVNYCEENAIISIKELTDVPSKL